MSAQATKITTVFIALTAFAATVSCAAETRPLQAQTNQSNTFVQSDGRRISIWGSSVAKGVGDETNRGGYASYLQGILAPQGYTLVNQSKSGDNTVTISSRFESGSVQDESAEFLLSSSPDYVIIALSLGNEGVAQCQIGQKNRCTNSLDEAEVVFDQFATGLQRLVNRAREAGITPVIALPYARSDFWEREYKLTRRMNLLINSWDVPSINTLGAVDDGQGRWSRGLWADPFHPNAAGHHEISLSFVPSLFAALKAGKPTPQRVLGNEFARVVKDTRNAMTYTPNSTLRSFTVTFKVRAAKEGPVAAIHGHKLGSNYTMVRRSYGEFEWDTETLTLTPTERFTASLSLADEHMTYTSSNGSSLSAPLGLALNIWHDVSFTHYAGRGETHLYVDGKYAGSVDERLQPDSLSLGGTSATDYQDWMIHRAGLNHEEVQALHGNKLLQASLEIYVPLKGSRPMTNLAQSLSEIGFDASAISLETASTN